MTGRVVVGVDGSTHAGRALALAVEEAARRGATLVAVTTWPPPSYFPGVGYGTVPPSPAELERHARATLDEALAGLDEPAAVERVVTEGPAWRALVDAAAGADLLVVGSRGRGGFSGLLLGSTSHAVVTHAPCPVVVVPTADRADEAGSGS
jgi:nucleotide-binding universal stress UspA family protein